MLISDPAAQAMNPTQWLFELEGLALKDERHYEDVKTFFTVGRRSLIELLGLNIMPVEHEEIDASGAKVVRLKRPEEHEITPLSIFCGNEGVLSKVSELHEAYNKQKELDTKVDQGKIVEMTPEELDEFMREGSEEGDIAFLDDDPETLEKKLKWRSQENVDILKALVKPLEEKDKDLISDPSKVLLKAKKSKVRINGD